jgi:hypothetical protein
VATDWLIDGSFRFGGDNGVIAVMAAVEVTGTGDEKETLCSVPAEDVGDGELRFRDSLDVHDGVLVDGSGVRTDHDLIPHLRVGQSGKLAQTVAARIDVPTDDDRAGAGTGSRSESVPADHVRVFR